MDGRETTDRLLLLVYRRLRSLAAVYLRRERQGHTLTSAALVHEAYARMVDAHEVDWQGTTHFFATAARQMRRVLVEHARAAGRMKRGGTPLRVTLDPEMAVSPERAVDVLALDEALDGLARRSSRQGRVVELRVFCGLSVPEIAQTLGVSDRTVKQDWRVARAWLARRLKAARA